MNIVRNHCQPLLYRTGSIGQEPVPDPFPLSRKAAIHIIRRNKNKLRQLLYVLIHQGNKVQG